MSTGQIQPKFDSARAALVFALNTQVNYPAPAMTKAMRDGVAPKKHTTIEEQIKALTFKPVKPQLGASVHGVDAAGLRALISKQLTYLGTYERDLLTCVCVPLYIPCACGNVCCSGAKPNPLLKVSYARIYNYLAKEAVYTIDGDAGLTQAGYSTNPLLRDALLAKYVQGSNTRQALVIAQLAEQCGVTPKTVAKHRDLLWDHLQQLEGRAWTEISEIFDEKQITGFFA